MKTSRLTESLFTDTPCLTHEQLKVYGENRMKAHDRHMAELHLTDCELCSAAAAGYSAVTVTSEDIADINSRVDSL